MTTYAAYYNLATASRRTSAGSTASSTSSSNKSSTTKKIMKFLSPRMPLHEALTPTNAGRDNRVVEYEKTEIEHAPVRMYDSVLRRPLFQKAKRGNEMTISERRRSETSSTHGKPSPTSSIDRVYDQHLPGAKYFGLDEK